MVLHTIFWYIFQKDICFMIFCNTDAEKKSILKVMSLCNTY